MKIEIDGNGIPSFVCDHCLQKITNKEMIIKYDPKIMKAAMVVHKGTCDMNSVGGICGERDRGEDRWSWMTLRSFAERLMERYP